MLAAALFLAPDATAQCAMCKTALANSPEGRAIGADFNRAILVMMAAPYLVLSALAATFFRHRLRAALRRLVGRPARHAGPAPDIG